MSFSANISSPLQLLAHANHKARQVRLGARRLFPVPPERLKRDWIMVATPRASESTVGGIMAQIANEHDLTVDEIIGSRQTRRIVEARHDAIVAVRKAYPFLSLPQLGRHFRKDHTSILHALRKREAL